MQQTLKGLPEFRKHGGNSAYAEGWALYAEQLGKEVGFYQDPGSDYGRLRSELFRAVRLVVDTGIHDMGWTRDQVVEFMRNSHAVDEPTIQSETDRYISWPAQALQLQARPAQDPRASHARHDSSSAPRSTSASSTTRFSPAAASRSIFSMRALPLDRGAGLRSRHGVSFSRLG